MSLKEHHLYQHLKAFKKLHQGELMRRYGAHSIGIGWKRRAGNKTAEPCLTFYVSHKHERAENPVPRSFSFLPEGKSRRVTLPTDVVEIPKPLAEKPHE